MKLKPEAWRTSSPRAPPNVYDFVDIARAYNITCVRDQTIIRYLSNKYLGNLAVNIWINLYLTW